MNKPIYMQQMLSANVGDVVLPVEIQAQDAGMTFVWNSKAI